MSETLVVDANPLLSALLGGQVREVLGLPIWTEDRDFDGLPNVLVYKTADLLSLLASGG